MPVRLLGSAFLMVLPGLALSGAGCTGVHDDDDSAGDDDGVDDGSGSLSGALGDDPPPQMEGAFWYRVGGLGFLHSWPDGLTAAPGDGREVRAIVLTDFPDACATLHEGYVQTSQILDEYHGHEATLVAGLLADWEADGFPHSWWFASAAFREPTDGGWAPRDYAVGKDLWLGVCHTDGPTPWRERLADNVTNDPVGCAFPSVGTGSLDSVDDGRVGGEAEGSWHPSAAQAWFEMPDAGGMEIGFDVPECEGLDGAITAFRASFVSYLESVEED